MFSKEQFTTVTPLSKALAMIVFIILPFIFFFVGVRYGQRGLAPVVVVETDKNEGVDEQGRNVGNTIYSIESIGLDFALPSGWIAEKIVAGGENHTFSKVGNDLSVVTTISALNRGWTGGCEGNEIDVSERDIKILISENVPGYDKYYIVGFKKVGAYKDYGLKDALFISNSSDSNWYDSLQTDYSYDNRTVTADLRVGEIYATCLGVPRNGLALTSPVAASIEGQEVVFTRISIESDSHGIAAHMESSNSELDEALSILKSITPTR